MRTISVLLVIAAFAVAGCGDEEGDTAAKPPADDAGMKKDDASMKKDDASMEKDDAAMKKDGKAASITLGDSELTQYAGTYDSIHAKIHISPDDGALVLKVEYKPEMLVALRESGEDEPPDYPPFPLGILPPPGDNYIVTGGPAKGMKGYFVRDESGAIQSVHVGGRLATRVGDRPE